VSWAVTKLADVAIVSAGRTPKGFERHVLDHPRDDRSIPLYKVGDMNVHPRLLTSARTWLAPDEVSHFSLKLLPRGTVVFPKAGGAIATNKKRVIERVGCVDLNCMAVTAGSALDAGFLLHFFNGVELASLADGSILPQIGKSRVSDLIIPVPSLDEQRRIVAMLEEHLTSIVDAETSIATARRRATAAWLSMLVKMRSRIEGHADLLSLGSLASTALGKMLDAARQTGAPTPYLRNINVRWGSFDLHDVQTTPLTHADRARLELRDGDLMVCEGGEPGRCAVWSGSGSGMAFQKALHRVRVDRRIVLPGYLALILEEGVKVGRWDHLFTGTTIKHLPQQQLRKLEIPVPSMTDQSRLLCELSELKGQLDRVTDQVGVAQDRAIGLRRAVLAAAFAGRLTGRSSDEQIIDEFAEETA
jgi:type I restriction enzyme, S subunit